MPAPFVPEDLVTQAQVVLQGKSRSLIIRELQVTVMVKKYLMSKEICCSNVEYFVAFI